MCYIFQNALFYHLIHSIIGLFIKLIKNAFRYSIKTMATLKQENCATNDGVAGGLLTHDHGAKRMRLDLDPNLHEPQRLQVWNKIDYSLKINKYSKRINI